MINDLSDLKKLLQLCRKQGVTEIDLGTVKIKLGDLPVDNSVQPVDEQELLEKEIAAQIGMPPGFEGVDPMAFYSSAGNQ